MDAQPLLPNVTDPVDDELVAALAAVEAYIAAEQPVHLHAEELRPIPAWRDAAKLVVQYIEPRRTVTPLRWSTIERLRRDTGHGSGVVGL